MMRANERSSGLLREFGDESPEVVHLDIAAGLCGECLGDGGEAGVVGELVALAE